MKNKFKENINLILGFFCLLNMCLWFYAHIKFTNWISSITMILFGGKAIMEDWDKYKYKKNDSQHQGFALYSLSKSIGLFICGIGWIIYLVIKLTKKIF